MKSIEYDRWARQHDINCSAIHLSPSGLLPQVLGCQPPDQFPFMRKLMQANGQHKYLIAQKEIGFAEKYAAWRNYTIKKLIKKVFTGVSGFFCCCQGGTKNLIYCCWIHFLENKSWRKKQVQMAQPCLLPFGCCPHRTCVHPSGCSWLHLQSRREPTERLHLASQLMNSIDCKRTHLRKWQRTHLVVEPLRGIVLIKINNKCLPGSWRERCRRGPCSGNTSQAVAKRRGFDMKELIHFLTWNGSSVNFLRLYLSRQLWVEEWGWAPGQLSLSVVECQWHSRHLNSMKLWYIRIREPLPVCLCCRPCSSDGMCASGSRCNEKASGYLSER